ncbi:MAG: hypothetical protein ACK4SF_11945 [Algoriphagus aquaeductus]|uniref:hypothetical protein n=1 Tax=Algoriphagus aquaeductus TaxID=475299 RepID=UPI00391D37B4
MKTSVWKKLLHLALREWGISGSLYLPMHPLRYDGSFRSCRVHPGPIRPHFLSTPMAPAGIIASDWLYPLKPKNPI